MPRITRTVTIAAAPERLWNEVGAFGDVGDWHPMLNSVEIHSEGRRVTRVARAKGGATQVERLQAFDPERHLYRYTMERSDLPVHDYTGEFQIVPAGDGASTVSWSAKFELAPEGDGRTIEAVRRFLQAGTESLRQRYNPHS